MPNPIERITGKSRGGRPRVTLPDQAEHNAVSLEKHGGNLRYKSAYIASLIAEDIIRLFSRSGKKDKEYLKGLVWSFGVMFDKAAGGASQDAISIRIPAKLLDNVKAVIAIQASKKARPLDSVSSAPLVISSTCETVVPEQVPQLVDPTS